MLLDSILFSLITVDKLNYAIGHWLLKMAWVSGFSAKNQTLEKWKKLLCAMQISFQSLFIILLTVAFLVDK